MSLKGAIITVLVLVLIWEVGAFFMQFSKVNDKATDVARMTGLLDLMDILNGLGAKDLLERVQAWYADFKEMLMGNTTVASLHREWVDLKGMFWGSNLGLWAIHYYNVVLKWLARHLHDDIDIDAWLDDLNQASDDIANFDISQCTDVETVDDVKGMSDDDLLGDVKDDDGNPILASLTDPIFLRNMTAAIAIQSSPSIAIKLSKKLAPIISRIATRTSTKVGIKIMKKTGVEVGAGIGKLALKGLARHTFKSGLKAGGKAIAKSAIKAATSPLFILDMASLAIDIWDPADFGSLDVAIQTKKDFDAQIDKESKTMQYPARVGPVNKLMALDKFESEMETAVNQVIEESGAITDIAAKLEAKASEITSCAEFNELIDTEVNALDMEAIGNEAIKRICLNNHGIMVKDKFGEPWCQFKDRKSGCKSYMEVSDAVAYSFTEDDCVMIMDGIRDKCIEGKAAYDANTGRCTIHKKWCLNKGGFWANGKCSVPTSQQISELIFGTTVVRGTKVLVKETNKQMDFAMDSVLDNWKDRPSEPANCPPGYQNDGAVCTRHPKTRSDPHIYKSCENPAYKNSGFGTCIPRIYGRGAGYTDLVSKVNGTGGSYAAMIHCHRANPEYQKKLDYVHRYSVGAGDGHHSHVRWYPKSYNPVTNEHKDKDGIPMVFTKPSGAHFTNTDKPTFAKWKRYRDELIEIENWRVRGDMHKHNKPTYNPSTGAVDGPSLKQRKHWLDTSYCERTGLIMYPKCKPGYSTSALNICKGTGGSTFKPCKPGYKHSSLRPGSCRVDCEAKYGKGWVWHGETCHLPMHTKPGGRSAMTCPSGYDTRIGHRCYMPCQSGWKPDFTGLMCNKT